MTARAGVEPTTLRLKVIDSTKAPSRPTTLIWTSDLFQFLEALFHPLWLLFGLMLVQCMRHSGAIGNKCLIFDRMVDDLHRLITFSSQQPRPLILVGAEMGALVARFFAQIYEE